MQRVMISATHPRWKRLTHVHHTWHCCDINMSCNADVTIYDKELKEYICEEHFVQIFFALAILNSYESVPEFILGLDDQE